MVNGNSLNSFINISKGECLTLVGAGGKTSFMLNLASELKHYGKVAVTTTTKIYPPSDKFFNHLYIGDEKRILKCPYNSNGVYVVGSSINTEGKIISVKEWFLDKLLEKLDYIIIEGDGSKGKPLKGWKDHEPVIPDVSNKTVGILDIESVGMEICEENVHRSGIFTSITDSSIGDKVTIEHLKKIVEHPKGLFKFSKGERILFINKVESMESYNFGIKLSEMLKDNVKIDKIIIGSIKNRKYNLIK
ncbi:selenium cofactor biosynthesis protein YqeC [Clostridium sediminicola]|uniref:selenium cofactor biosynthesis protein YqeC n=1 Tax=Clostridium sediminicola TaxID=3114879 RepID=UPI0031F1DF28